MRPKKSSPSMSDKQLRQSLAGLREEVAAPPDFRAQLIQRLQAEGLITGMPAPVVVRVSLWDRLTASLTPMRLGLVASAAVALVLVIRDLPTTVAPISNPTVASNRNVSVGAGSPRPAPARAEKNIPVVPQNAPAPEMASVPKPKTTTMPEALLDKTQPRPQVEAVVGSAETSAPSRSIQMNTAAAPAPNEMPQTGIGGGIQGASAASAASADAKPTVIVVEPTATPVVKPLQGNSELRGNVIRASRGESCVFLYKVLKAGHVHIEIFDRLGHSVTVLKDADQTPGTYELHWGGQSDSGVLAASGIYVLQLQAPLLNAQHKLLLVK